MLLVFFGPLILVISGVFTSVWMLFLLFVISGLGMAGIGMGIMHDAIHGSYSKYKLVNKLMGATLNMIGASDEVWKLQHNVLHHSYTNIEEHDDDINAPFFLRFSPNTPHNKLHRFQVYYAWIFYGLSTLSWITAKDFIRLNRYYKDGFVKSKEAYRNKLIKIISWKVLYFSYALVLPMLVSPYAPWLILLAFIAMHFVTGLSITLVFQTAHVMPDSNFPVPDENGTLETDRILHQIQTTCNYAPKSNIFSWLIGGLNHQIEHHIFPTISHIHYKDISKIVRITAAEFGVKYHCYPTFYAAVKNHFKMLYLLGKMQPAFVSEAPKTVNFKK
ncbi:fatty acid desaturase family protein [Zhouia sp. PK063]|uniref:fatty acid desaturase family protein n=1 Tax=Zhouia sp. PK063 TaxID=3373602 RepID=UPI0037B8CDC6